MDRKQAVCDGQTQRTVMSHWVSCEHYLFISINWSLAYLALILAQVILR